MRPPVFVAATDELAGDRIALRGAEGRHASTVRRLAPGERVEITDGAGTLAFCEVTAARPGELELAVLSRQLQPEPQPRLVVLQAIPKGYRGELAVELLTEVGADVIVPWAAQRCVAVWRGERAVKARARWASAAHEAAKQSRRAWFPEITEQADLPVAVRRIKAAALAIVLDPDASDRLASLELPAEGEIVLAVGPEGGITASEYAAMRAAGAIPCALGPTVLRASTAGLVAASVMLSRTAGWKSD
ncbi:MAG: 16S rRNA (uracil(1498)-N(3))-methyltransferase [Actinobacteria bacterium]|nr:16S rRNA (uracil(1498)-N(3))-methyltransferase [Actinomycetota bacterium]